MASGGFAGARVAPRYTAGAPAGSRMECHERPRYIAGYHVGARGRLRVRRAPTGPPGGARTKSNNEACWMLGAIVENTSQTEGFHFAY